MARKRGRKQGSDGADDRLERLRSLPFMDDSVPVLEEIDAVPGMLTRHEKKLLYFLARDDYRGDGVILDLGTFLGGSAICFAAGLKDQGFDRRVIHSYDVFKVGLGASQTYFPEGAPSDLSTRDKFEEHLRDHLDLIAIHEGDVLAATWDGEPVEIMFIDIAKSYRTFDHLLTTFFPALIPGRSLVVVQDYLWGTSGPWHHVVMEKLSDYFEYVADTKQNSALFFLRREIPQSVLESCLWLNIPQDEKLRLMDSAIEKLDTEQKKDYLRQNREILAQGKDTDWGMMYHEV
jgi:hypothetical protein